MIGVSLSLSLSLSLCLSVSSVSQCLCARMRGTKYQGARKRDLRRDDHVPWMTMDEHG